MMMRRVMGVVMGVAATPMLLGCSSAGHRRETLDVGLSLLGIKLVSIARITTEHVGEPSVRAGARMTGTQPDIPAGFKLLDTSNGIKLLDIGPPTYPSKSPELPRPPGPPGTSIPEAPGAGADTSPASGGPPALPIPTPQPPPAYPHETSCLFCGKQLLYTDDGLRDLEARGLDPDICAACAIAGGR